MPGKLSRFYSLIYRLFHQEYLLFGVFSWELIFAKHFYLSLDLLPSYFYYNLSDHTFLFIVITDLAGNLLSNIITCTHHVAQKKNIERISGKKNSQCQGGFQCHPQ